MNRIDALFKNKQKNILSVYYTAGFPKLNSTLEIASSLEQAGADMLEIGMPYSDPLADGPVIQHSSTLALKNGMTIPLLFEQLKNFREKCDLPALLMGYLNPVIQFGFDKFCEKSAACGIDGIIVPDLPLDETAQYQNIFCKNNMHCVLLITPQTPVQRLRKIASLSSGFIYMVSSASTTGKSSGFSIEQKNYFKKIKQMKFTKPILAGFGIYDSATFRDACKYSNGAIIGSFFIRLLEQYEPKEAAGKLISSLTTTKQIES